jgi:glycosyltransferase A (GT-A) superfamily protein (DUF2064 family)
MPAIVLFARSPEREAAAKRMPAAAPLFRAVVAAWLEAAHAHGATPLIACEPRDREALAAIAPHLTRGWIEQPHASFGARVVEAASVAFSRGFGQVVIAAIDAPPPARLGHALHALANGVAVIGPACDGGINFIGITALDRALLEDLTLQHCIARLPRAMVFESATDVDSPRALDIARGERAWRGYFAVHAIARPSVVARTSHGITHPHTSRPPPFLWSGGL